MKGKLILTNLKECKKTDLGEITNSSLFLAFLYARLPLTLIAENFGGKVLGSVSKKLDILVVGNLKPTKKKIDRAKELKIKIYSEDEWYNFLNI